MPHSIFSSPEPEAVSRQKNGFFEVLQDCHAEREEKMILPLPVRATIQDFICEYRLRELCQDAMLDYKGRVGPGEQLRLRFISDDNRSIHSRDKA